MTTASAKEPFSKAMSESDVISIPLPLNGLVGTIAHSPAHSLAHLTSDGSPTGLASWGDSVTVRALLQNFRC